MPTYVFRCSICSDKFEQVCSYEESKLVRCDKCGTLASRVPCVPHTFAKKDIEPRKVGNSVVSTRVALEEACKREGLVCPSIQSNVPEFVGTMHDIALSSDGRDSKVEKLQKKEKEWRDGRAKESAARVLENCK